MLKNQCFTRLVISFCLEDWGRISIFAPSINKNVGAPGFFRGRSTQTLHDSINKGFICMSGRIVVPLRHLIIEV